MAKKEKKEEGVVVQGDDFTKLVCEQVEKEYGENTVISGVQALAEKRIIIPWSPSLDIITSGGIQEGCWVNVTGPEKSGKTTAALSLAANAQKPEYGNRTIYYFKIEGRLSMVHLRGIKGLDFDRLKIIQSTPPGPDPEKQPGRILTAQDFLRIAEKVIRTIPGAFVIFDSISALCDEKETTGGIGTETRGGGAKLFSQFIRLMNQVVPTNRCVFIGITHQISNTSGMGAALVEKSAKAFKYQYDYSLRTKQKEAWKAEEKQIGLKATWVCNTSVLGPPGMSMTSYLRFGTGIDRLYELLELAVAAGLIVQTKSWYELKFLNDKSIPKVNGAEKLYKLLVEKPEYATELEKQVLTMAGALAGSEE